MNIAQAKKIYHDKWGHGLRMGYEALVDERIEAVPTYFTADGRRYVDHRADYWTPTPYGLVLRNVQCTVRTWLVNESGHFRIRETISER